MSTSIVLDPFCHRQFDDERYTGSRIEMEKGAFAAHVNTAFESGAASLVDGYAPFCKHLFLPNFAGVHGSVLAITPENEALLRTTYDARSEDELPVLVRFFPAATAPEPPVAEYLDIILYSREQIRKETAAMGKEEDGETAPWGIISVKAQDVDYELPMQPSRAPTSSSRRRAYFPAHMRMWSTLVGAVTMMRNALGADEGGSGVALDRSAYKASVAFWESHAPIR